MSNCKNVRNKFHKYYNNDILCKLGCTQEVDSQKHMLSCHRVISQLGKEDKGIYEYHQDLKEAVDQGPCLPRH